MSEQKKLKALILVGGFGTRLRPLTFSKPKPLVEFINKPMLVHQIEALKEVGVDEVILAVNYQSEKMQDFLNIVSQKYQIKLSLSKENEPLGTAGPIGLAKEILLKAEGEEIFVFNSDITCKFPLKEMLEFHRKHGKEGTIATTKVKDPSRFGVIVSENNKILRFVEKPKEFVGDDINAGLYVFNKKFLNRVNPVPTSIEREVFPQMASDGELYKFSLEGFWADIGQPKDFLFGTKLFLEHLNKNNKDLLQKESNIIKGNVFFGENVKVEEGAVIGPNVVLGDNVVIKKGTKIINSVVLQNVVVSEYSFINDCIIGWKSQIGKWVRMEELCVIGEDVNIKDEVYLKNNVILPNVTIKASPKEGSVIMC